MKLKLTPISVYLHLRYLSTSLGLATAPAAITSSMARFMPLLLSTRQLEIGVDSAWISNPQPQQHHVQQQQQ
jgi:hypothetical protein